MQSYIDKFGIGDRDQVIRIANALVQKYGPGSAELACRMYDRIAEMQDANVEQAEQVQMPDYGEVARAINGSLKDSETGKLVAPTVSRMVKQTASDTMLKNAKRDCAEFAWIPSGDSCVFCELIASQGWRPATKETVQGDHADHIHPNCRCEFAIRFKHDLNVAGYDPEGIRKEFEDAEGSTWEEKAKSLRNERDRAAREELMKK